MLYPKVSPSRAMMDLNGLWRFKLLTDDRLPESMADAETLAVPASYNEQRERPEFRNHRGWAAYERTLCVPSVYQGQRLCLRFDSVTHQARVYLDGELIGEHRGGFLPFELDVTDRLPDASEHRLTVLVDNTISHATLPIGNEPDGISFLGTDNEGVPAVEAAKRHRRTPNLPNFDFFNYAGIQRPVRLVITPKSYLSDIALVPAVDGADGVVRYQVTAAGDASDAPISVDVLNEAGDVVASAEGAQGSLRIQHAQLWEPAPGKPYLYTARVRYGDDCYDQPFGVRTVEVRGTQFLINGKPFYFKGFGKHEDFPVHGRGFDLCLDVKDVSLIHWINANSFRTSHYPYAEEMYDLCDREGIVVIDETPAVGIAAPKEDPYTTFPIREHHEQVLRELVARDKNHPCVVMWSMGNEPETDRYPDSAYDYWHSLYELTHQLDPQNRPVTFVACQNDYYADRITREMDVVCINRYYGWYNLSGDMDAACYALNTELDFWAQQGKPLILTEYGADTIAGVHMTVPEMFSEEFQVEFYRRTNAELDKRDFVIGEHPWNFADFATTQGVLRADGNRKGLFTRDRRPKMAAHYFRDRWGKFAK